MFAFGKQSSSGNVIPPQQQTAANGIDTATGNTSNKIVADLNTKGDLVPVIVATPKDAQVVAKSILPNASPAVQQQVASQILTAAKKGHRIYGPKKKSSSLPWVLGIGAAAVLGISLIVISMSDD